MTAGPSLHIARDSTGVDIDAAERAAAGFLAALGIDVDHEDLRATPARMARAYAEMFDPAPFELTTFPNDEGYDELVLARGHPGRSRSASTTCCRSSASRTSATCPASGSSGCPSWPGWSSCSPAGRRSRSGSPSRSPTGSQDQLRAARRRRRLEAEHSCMTLRGVRAPARGRSRRHCTARCATTRLPGRVLHPDRRAAQRSTRRVTPRG